MFQTFVISGPAPQPVQTGPTGAAALALGLPTSPSTTSAAQPAFLAARRRLVFDDESDGETESESEGETDMDSESEGEDSDTGQR